MQQARGFTILELMIGLAITGVLATLSFSAFKSTSDKADFKSMHEVASRLALSQQRHRLTYSRYASQISTSGNPSQTTLVFSEASSYKIAIAKATMTEFQLTVEPKTLDNNSAVQKHCYKITVSSKQGFLDYASSDYQGASNTDCLPHV